MADYSQPPDVNRRVRFFDGQYLVEQDFVDEQKYHLDRERRTSKVLHITGVVEGLRVTSAKKNSVTVSPGTAFDAQGRHVVLVSERTVELPAAAFNNKQGVRVLAIYREEPVEMATSGTLSERRWVEDPRIVAATADGQSTERWPDDLPPVQLALIRLDGNGVVTVDGAVAQRAGLRLPGRLGVGTAGDAQAELDVLGTVRFGDGSATSGLGRLTASSTRVALQGQEGTDRLTIQQANGNVGVGVPSPTARVDVVGVGETRNEVALSLRSGNTAWNTGAAASTQLAFGYHTTAQYRHVIRTRHNGGERAGNAFDFYVWKQGTDTVDATGTLHNLTLEGGYVGVGGTTSPRTSLDTGLGVVSGAANDYQKAQHTLSGGGTVSWTGPDEWRLKWSNRFIAITAERGRTMSSGYIDLYQPTTDIPASQTHDGLPRAADASGVRLAGWDALYAVHQPGQNNAAVTYQVKFYTSEFHAPSNWILVAVVNADDNTVKLGTGVILSARSSSTKGSPIPTGTIVMWSGASNAIPDGWALCDGGGGRPDLVGRFVMGGRTGAGGDNEPGRYGEADSHTHPVYPSGKAFATSADGNHNHAPPSDWYDRNLVGDVSAINTRYNAIDRGGPSVKSVRTSTDGNHQHTVTVNLDGVNSGSQSGAIRPRWWTLCYIIKL